MTHYHVYHEVYDGPLMCPEEGCWWNEPDSHPARACSLRGREAAEGEVLEADQEPGQETISAWYADHGFFDGPGMDYDPESGTYEPDFPPDFEGAGPMYAAVPMGLQWVDLAVRGEITYTVETSGLITPGMTTEQASAAGSAYGGWSAFLDRADVEPLADARDGMYVRYEGLAAHDELTPAREAMCSEPGQEPEA